MGVDRAATILQVQCLPEVLNELVNHSGWSLEIYKSWLVEVLKYELLEGRD